jgi:hypothetical protein
MGPGALSRTYSCGNAAYIDDVQTVVETPDYLADAKSAGLTETDRADIVELLSKNPTAGDLIVGTGGARKLRVGGRGKGKSGGYRVITYLRRN